MLSVILLIALSSVGCTDTTPETHIQQGQAFASAGKFKAAEIEFKNAIKKDPTDPAYRSVLGQLYLDAGNYLGAEKELNTAWERGEQSQKLAEGLARALWLNRRTKQIQTFYEQLPADYRSDIVKSYLGLAELDAGNIDNARQLLNTLSEGSSHRQLLAAKLLLSERKPRDAVNLLAALDATQLPDLLLVRGLAFLSLDQHSSAIESFTQFLNAQPAAIQALVPLTLAEIGAGQLDSAYQHAQTVLRKNPYQPVANLALAYKFYDDQDYKKALEHADRAVSYGLNQPPMLYLAALSAFHLGSFETSYRHLQAMDHQIDRDHPAKRLKLVVENKLGRDENLVLSITDMEPNLSSSDMELVEKMAFKLIVSNKHEDAKSLLESLDKRASDDPTRLARAGLLHLMSNDKKGIELLKKATALDKNMPASELALAISMLNNGETEEPKKIAFKLISEHPDKAAGFILLGGVHQKNGDFKRAVGAYDKAIGIAPSNLDAHLNKVAILFKNESDTTALSALDNAIESTAHHPAFVLMRNRVRPQETLDTLLAAANANPESTVYPVLLSGHYYTQGDLSQALNLLAEFEHGKDVSAFPGYYWKNKYVIQRRRGGAASAEESISQFLQSGEESDAATLFAISHYRSIGQERKALDLATVAIKNTNSLKLKLERVQLLIDLGRIEEAHQEYSKVKQFSGEIAREIDLAVTGQIHLNRGHFATAAAVFEELYQDYRKEKYVLFLGSAYEAEQQQDRARLLYKGHLDKYPGGNKLKLAYADTLARIKEPQALALYQELLQKHPDNIILNNNIADYLLNTGQPETAQPYIVKALEAAPNSAVILHTYASVMLAQGDHDAALEKIKAAYSITNGASDAVNERYREILVASGRSDEADKLFRQLSSRP